MRNICILNLGFFPILKVDQLNADAATADLIKHQEELPQHQSTSRNIPHQKIIIVPQNQAGIIGAISQQQQQQPQHVFVAPQQQQQSQMVTMPDYVWNSNTEFQAEEPEYIDPTAYNQQLVMDAINVLSKAVATVDSKLDHLMCAIRVGRDGVVASAPAVIVDAYHDEDEVITFGKIDSIGDLNDFEEKLKNQTFERDMVFYNLVFHICYILNYNDYFCIYS